jgi:hypothetical protein
VEIEDYLSKVERTLILGAGRWVAGFNESFRNFCVGKHTFDLFVRGSLRTKGLFLSRFLAWFSLPDYNVAFYVKHVPDDNFNFESLKKAVEERSEKNNVKWTWLVLVRAGAFPEQLAKQVDAFEKPALGVTLVNIADGDVDTSSNQLGRRAQSLLLMRN